MTFQSFDLRLSIFDALEAMGFETPTPIQADCIPPLLAGDDLVGQARTGSGKTAAFGVPMVDALVGSNQRGVVGLILAPTRELAIQIHEVLIQIAKGSDLEVAAVYGGVGFDKQERALSTKGKLILVATPGRLLDLVGRKVADLSKVEFLVLDEADRMLDMGFVRDMRRILALLPVKRQTALFSATLPDSVMQLVQEFTDNPHMVRVDQGQATPNAKQFRAQVQKAEKTGTLLQMFLEDPPGRAVVFTRTKHLAKRLAKKLDSHGWSSVALQGNMTQNQRERSLAHFKTGTARVLVATDVAARGLDVDGVTHVINFDLPEPDAYVHRIGRTARNGASGTAITFVQPDEERDWRLIEKIAGKQVEPLNLTFKGNPPRGPDEPVPLPQPAVNHGAAGRKRGGTNKPSQAGANAKPQGQRNPSGPARGQGGNRGPRRPNQGNRAPRRSD